MDHHRVQASAVRSEPFVIDLGHEAPLAAEGGPDGIDRRRVSLQWLSGTILTGLCGAALMGGAVFASLDGETNFASLPERLESALRGPLAANADRGAVARKSDKILPGPEPSVARQVIRVSTATRSSSGDREVMRVRPLVRVAGNLSLTVSQLSANIPPFNPQRMLADTGAGGAATAADETPAAEPDSEVSFVMRDLGPALPKAKIGPTLSLEDVLMRVREAASWTGGTRPAVPGVQPPIRFAYAVEGDTSPTDPYGAFAPRIIPENVTLLPKTNAQTTGGNSWSEKVVVVKKGDTATSILHDLGASADEARAIAAVLGPRGRDGGLREGLKLRVLLGATGPLQRLQPVRVIIANDTAAEAVVALSDMGQYVPVDVQSINTATEVAEAGEADDEEDDGSGVRLYQSIYETALRNQVPRPVIDNLVRIYSYDVDFQRKVRPGDSFEVLYSGDEDGAGDGKNDVLFAALTVGGEQKKYYRFQTPDDGVVDYYDEGGKSAKKFLVRKPVADAIMRSGFGVRRHPVLGYTKMHTGVDWAAAAGTPIYSAGNGTIEKAGWESGYGKYIRIRHANGYETAYGHMLAFARGIEPGTRVRQGQVIGFVGSTGLATGPHCHFEILVNGRFVDPMRIKLPRGRVLDGPMLAAFDKVRDQVDGTMTRNGSAPRVAQTQAGG